MKKWSIIKIPFALCFIGILAVVLIQMLSPEGFGRFLYSMDPEEQGNRIQLEQSTELIQAWEAAPLFGNGFGIALPSGYIRSVEQPYLYELQYHSLLFKSGIVGLLAILTIPLATLIILYRSTRWLFLSAMSNSVSLLISIALGIMVISIAGAYNPYLASAYYTFLAAFLFAVYDSPDFVSIRPNWKK